MTKKQRMEQKKRFAFIENTLKRLSYNAWPNPELRAIKKRIMSIEHKIGLVAK